jgi:hypothetical protein
VTPEEVAATGERARDLLSLANRDQISAPSRTTAVLANDVLALVSLVSEQAAALAVARENVKRLRFQVEHLTEHEQDLTRQRDAALAGER